MPPPTYVDGGIVVLRFNPFDLADIDNQMTPIARYHQPLNNVRLSEGLRGTESVR
jgi:hypothetical protein